MVREPHIPLFLWVATALLVHLIGGGGADQAAQVVEDRLDVQRFASSVRRHVRLTTQPMEVALLTDEELAIPSTGTPSDADDNEEMADELDQTPPESPPDRKISPEDEAKQDDELKREPDDNVKPPELKKDEPKAETKKENKKEEDKKKDEAPKTDLPVVPTQNRIAVVQHVEDKNQEDNPNAEFIGDEANHVKEQTQARITATDQNDPDPTPGTSNVTAAPEPGNSHVTDVAHSEDAPGDMDRAPNEQAGGKKAAFSSAAEKGGGNPNASSREARLEAKGTEQGRDNGSDSNREARAARDAVAASRGAEAAPDTMSAPRGGFHVHPPQEAREARREQRGQARRLPPRKGTAGPMDFLGLGASGTTRGGINLNLTHTDAASAVGRDQLARERLADGERRRSKHRGSWKTLGIERWRAAIENYNSSVKPGNQTALNTARVPFASYLNQIHNRLHPVFADSFLASLDSLPQSHPLNRPDIKTNLEIVLDRDEGKVVKMGVTRSSGSTVFDIAALESVQSASPFGKPPKVIVSPDGKVYLHWEFYRNPYYACSTYFARPFILKTQPEEAPPNVAPPERPPFGPREQPVPREGSRATPRGAMHAAR